MKRSFLYAGCGDQQTNKTLNCQLRRANNAGETVGATHKPNLVPDSGYPKSGNDHSSMDGGCPSSLATYPGTRTGNPQKLPYLVLHRVGFAKLPRSPGELVRSYRTVSPLPDNRPMSLVPGGILSVALSFASPRLHVMKHPALRCSDFPPDQCIDPAIVCVTPAVCYDLPNK